MNEDQELKKLKARKEHLIEKASGLLRKLKDQEEHVHVVKIKKSTVKRTPMNEKLAEQYNKLSMLKEITGISFQNTDRKWHNGTFKYMTSLRSDSLNMEIELTVKPEANDRSEVCDIACNVTDLHQCYMSELKSLLKFVVRKKSFSLLISAISQYNEQNLIRRKLLDKLKATNYISYEECSNKHGGILVHVHSPNNLTCEYLTVQWVIGFRKNCWYLENHFSIEAEPGFVESNNVLLENFSQGTKTKEELVELWSKLCFGIDVYENREQAGAD